MQLDIQKLEQYIEDALNNCDATLIGGFSGSVIELLGRFLGQHNPNQYQECYKDFLKIYLPIYYSKGDLLYKLLRCEGAHAVIAQSGVKITSDTVAQNLHLKCVCDKNSEHFSLIIYLPTFISDLRKAIKNFFTDVKSEPSLTEKCQDIFNKIYKEGQDIISQDDCSKNAIIVNLIVD